MRIPRIYHPEPLAAGATVELSASAAHHLLRVLRLQPGAPLILFDGCGGQYRALLAEAGRKGATASLVAHQAVELESPLVVTLAQGVSKGERMDYAIQKAVELGVARIVPVLCERTVVSLKGDRWEKKLAHWRGVIVGAAEQCGRNCLPQLSEPLRLDALLASPPTGIGVVLDPGADQGLAFLERETAATLLVGPEGGLSDQEIAAAVRAGYTGVRMGPRVLRTETAAVAALSALQVLWGDLG